MEPKEKKLLKDVLPIEFFGEFMKSGAAKHLDVQVVSEKEFCFVDGIYEEIPFDTWPGPQKHVYVWWILANGYAVGWNENPCRGWSFPVIKYKG